MRFDENCNIHFFSDGHSNIHANDFAFQEKGFRGH